MSVFEYIEKLKNMKLDLTYKVVTFGCQMNAKDSEKIEGMLYDAGLKDAKDQFVADIVIFNTCTVRENANNTLYGHVGELKNSYLNNKNKIICICGCMMQEKDEIDIIKERFPYVKIIFGTYNIHEIPEILYNYLNDNKKIVKVYDKPQGIIENLPTINKYPNKCGINISYGCNNYCTYCIVPYVRGPERSREKEDIIDEIKIQIKKGVDEIMLLGQNVNSYGLDNGSCTFPELLSEVSKIDGLKCIRFMSSHPKDFSNELINVIKNNNNIAKHIHLPLQSGSDRILKLMNRKYSRSQYIDIIDNIRREMPDASITTDIIVGFPTETEEDFNDTLSMVEYVKYDSAFTFKYSKRNGTIAKDMDGQIDDNIKNERFERLLNMVNKFKKSARDASIAFSILMMISISIFLSACNNKNVIESSFFALDTIINIKLYDYENKNKALDYLDECKKRIIEYEKHFSKTIEGSEIYNLNLSLKNENDLSNNYTGFSMDTYDMIELSNNTKVFHNGDFDIRLGELIDLWTKAREENILPDEAEIKNALNNYNNGKYQYDLGGIAKGYIADRLYELKDEYYIKSAIINLGGNLYVIGDKYGTPFTVGIDKPFYDGEVIDTEAVSDKTVVTSGIYQRYLKIDGDDRIYHHILDKKTGYPTDTEVLSATVITSNSAVADILATCLVMNNIEEGKKISKKAAEYLHDNIKIIIINKNYDVIKYTVEY